jgi:hypothetical protein
MIGSKILAAMVYHEFGQAYILGQKCLLMPKYLCSLSILFFPLLPFAWVLAQTYPMVNPKLTMGSQGIMN